MLNSRALGLASSGEIKKQHVVTLLSSAARHSDGRAVAWDWITKNFEWLRTIYEGTGTLSRYFTYALPILGIDRSEEVAKFFDQHRAPETTKGVEAGLEKLGINQPKVSALANYRVDGFSVERLMTFLTALDQDVEIVIKNKPRSRAAGRISVVAG